MAKLLKKFDFDVKPAGGFASKYPWDTWFDGRIHLLTEGDDYTVTTEKMKLLLKNAAHKRGFELKANFVLVEVSGAVSKVKVADANGIAVTVEPGTDEQVAAWKQQAETRKAKLREKVKAKKEAAKAASTAAA